MDRHSFLESKSIGLLCGYLTEGAIVLPQTVDAQESGSGYSREPQLLRRHRLLRERRVGRALRQVRGPCAPILETATLGKRQPRQEAGRLDRQCPDAVRSRVLT